MPLTKIVCTLGPATDSYETIRKLIEADMSVARLNFSHGDYEEHARRISLVRQAAADTGKPIAILQDLCGPKIRTGEHVDNAPFELVAGQTFTITTQPVPGTSERVSTNYEALPNDVRAGDRVLISDGLIRLTVQKTTATDVICAVQVGGTLREKQGINLPGVCITAPSVTDKDILDLKFGLEQGVDYVAISFVRQASDITQVRQIIAGAGRQVPIIAKIERPEALEALEAILDASDGVMVARGDLGVEIPLQDVPMIQKRIIRAANFRAKPVITATQMLESMIYNPSPTRAEVSDVANAILDGSDAVMLSGETSIGKYPVEAVQMMTDIACAVEDSRHRASDDHPEWQHHQVQTVPQAVGTAATAIVQSLKVDAIWVFTQSGQTARLVSHYRPAAPIIAISPYDLVCRRMMLLWGVKPVQSPYFKDEHEFWQEVVPTVVRSGHGKPGDTVVLTGGHPFNEHGDTNFIKIMTIPAKE